VAATQLRPGWGTATGRLTTEEEVREVVEEAVELTIALEVAPTQLRPVGGTATGRLTAEEERGEEGEEEVW
jgi:hypothetical protein